MLHDLIRGKKKFGLAILLKNNPEGAASLFFPPMTASTYVLVLFYYACMHACMRWSGPNVTIKRNVVGPSICCM